MGWRWFLVSWCYMSACVFSASQLGSKFTPAGLLWWKYTLCLSFSPQFCFVFQHFCFGLCVFIWMKTSYHNKSTTSFFSSIQKVPMLLLLLWQQTLFSFFPSLALHASNQSETSVEIPQDPLTVFNLYHHGSIHIGTLQQLQEKFFTSTWDDIKNWSSRIFKEVECFAKSSEVHNKTRAAKPGHCQFLWKLCGIELEALESEYLASIAWLGHAFKLDKSKWILSEPIYVIPENAWMGSMLLTFNYDIQHHLSQL